MRLENLKEKNLFHLLHPHQKRKGNNMDIQEIIDEVVRIVNYSYSVGNPIEKVIYISPRSATENTLNFQVVYKRQPFSATE